MSDMRVIMPSFNDDLLETCLTSLEVSAPGSSSRVIVGDNGLSMAMRRRWAQCRYVPVPADPFVFSQAANLCMRAAGPDDDFLFLGDDMTIETPGWDAIIQDLFASWPVEYGVIYMARPDAPVTPGIVASETFAVGTSTLIPRSTVRVIGDFDERYIGYGYEDVDYCLRLLHAGLKIGIASSLRIRHGGTVAYQRRYGSWEALLPHAGVNFKQFYAKWGLTEPVPARVEAMYSAEHFRHEQCHCTERS